jgi:branched-subunit amino acid aminotransferase/4-amino-4-deoxychorismate lyase
MAGFEGIKWASKQMRYLLDGKKFDIQDADARVFAVSRSLHYGLCLAFEGIRFFCKKTEDGELAVIFFNWDKNLERFQRGIAFNLSNSQQHLVPTTDEMASIFVDAYFKEPSLRPFFLEMAEMGAQGYFRPFTVDEEQSIGVTFPGSPSIRGAVSRYDRYLGEPFSGVVVPCMIRAVGINKMGCLKLGVNYLISVKAVDAAKMIDPEAASALFLDDNTSEEIEKRLITEWDSSCCLFAFKDGRVFKIPESDLILPSVTIQGIVSILKEMGVPVEERDLTYGELIQSVKDDELAVVCSVGTAGILNRCEKLLLVDQNNKLIATHRVDKEHEIFDKLGEARRYYWDIYKEKRKPPRGMKLDRYIL